MKAVIHTSAGGLEVLAIEDVPQPEPGPSEVLVRVRASALNRADILQRQGKYPAPADAPQQIPGIEFAGEVAALGDKARLWRVGQRVFGITGGGAHAEYVTVHERTVSEIPDNISWIEAASIPEAFITAHDALWKQAELRPGETVLIHAVGSGVGLAAVQLARAMNAVPFGTSRTTGKIERARSYGLEDGLVVSGKDVPSEELKNFARSLTAEKGFNVVIDLVGGSYAGASVPALAPRGRMMLVGTLAGRTSEFDLGILLGKRVRITGTVLRARPLEEKIAANRSFADEVVPLFARGVLRAVVDSEFQLRDIRAAHARMESNQTFGKVVLRIAD
jgi:putative PIG3 family NAD(P)H quinone oxidoreductase